MTAYGVRISDWSSDVCSSDLRDQPVDLQGQRRAVVGGPGDDQRRARLVDQDGVDLVDDRVVEVALDHVLQAELHVVAQIVEAELVVGAVGDVAGIGPAPLVVGEAVDDAADAEPRSEEHTSELQSLMRIPYAVFCLKKQ